MRKIILLATFFFMGANIFAQTVVKGFVKDATTMEPLPFVSVYFNDNKGVMTGTDGSYSIETNNKDLKTLVFSHVGYKQIFEKLKPGKEQTRNVQLVPSDEMAAIIIKTRKRGKYRNKDNPAVTLIEHVIENKEKNQITSYDFVQFQQYEKSALFLSNNPEKLKKNLIFKKYKFILENVDTTTVEGKSLLPVYISEELSDKYLRKNPEEDKTVVLGERQVDYGDFLDKTGIKEYLNKLWVNINIYENNINILNSQFLSPIANMGPSFYRYYIRDTVEINGDKLVRLYFTPRNPTDLLFRGTMFITLDGNYGVQGISMTISTKANINWTRALRIKQDFEKASDGRYHVAKSTLTAEFSLFKKSSGSLFGERTESYKNFIINTPAPDSIYNEKNIIVKNNSSERSDSFWVDNRPIPLSPVEAKAYVNIDSLRNLKSFKRIGDIFTFLFSGYVEFGKWELGNINTFYSFNPVEGFRLKVGGRTTTKLSDRLFFDSYLAYGFKDEKFKYLLGATYSFNGKSVYSYPLNYLKISYQHEVTIPGQELLFVQQDNFFLSFKRGDDNKYLYNKYFKADYVREFGKNISYDITFKNWNQVPAGDIFFQKAIDNSTVKDITTTELSAQVRWAPNEQFYQKKEFRRPIINKYPIFLLKYSQGIKGLLNGEYNYQSVHFEVDKRFYLSQLGYVDASLEGSYIFGQLPFPLLIIPHANQTYAFQDHSYNMMNFLEFVSDRTAASSLDFFGNGFFLNKIPLLKKLKLREVATFKVLYGGLRDENNPEKNPDLLKFPTDSQEQPTTFSLGKTPYIEASVGVANIFKLIRLDLVKRVTYLNHPNVAKWGLRGFIQFNF